MQERIQDFHWTRILKHFWKFVEILCQCKLLWKHEPICRQNTFCWPEFISQNNKVGIFLSISKDSLNTSLHIIRKKPYKIFRRTWKYNSLNRVEWYIPEKNAGGWRHGLSRCIEEIFRECRISGVIKKNVEFPRGVTLSEVSGGSSLLSIISKGEVTNLETPRFF